MNCIIYRLVMFVTIFTDDEKPMKNALVPFAFFKAGFNVLIFFIILAFIYK